MNSYKKDRWISKRGIGNGAGGNKWMTLLKRYPNLSSRIVLGLSMLAMLGVHDADARSQGITEDLPRMSSELNVIAEILDKNLNLDANFDKSMTLSETVDKFFAHVALGVTELETYFEKTTLNPGEERYTRGPGLTWHYGRDVKGRIQQHINGPWLPVIGCDENYEQCKMHLEYETFKRIRMAAKGLDNITNRHVVAVALAGYQRPSDIRGILNRISKARSQQEVADAFQHFYDMSKNSAFYIGSLKRRWFCAALACGVIDVDNFIDMQPDAFSGIEVNFVYHNGHFKLDNATVAYALSRVKFGAKKTTCGKFLSGFALGRKILDGVNSCKHRGKFIDLGLEDEMTDVERAALQRLLDAHGKSNAGKYEDAVRAYQAVIDIHPYVIEAYNMLASVYKKIADENSDFESYEKCSEILQHAIDIINSNRGLLHDPDVHSWMYYNIGLSRAAMGDIYSKSGDMDLARKNYQIAQQNFRVAKEIASKAYASQQRIELYEAAIKRMDSLLGGKANEFKSGAKKVENHAYSADLTTYEIINKKQNL